MSVTFAVSPVESATASLRSIGPQRVFEALLGRAPEAWRVPSEPLVGHAYHHPLLQAAHLAFARHYPLTISPDAVWICLAQGFAQHLNANAEALRNRAVRHRGKLTLSVRRDDFVKGSPDNPWSEVFSSFSEQIGDHTAGLRELVVANFSTTGPVEQTTSELVLMNALQWYLDYEMVSLCGIPSITLLGSSADWRSIRERVQEFGRFGLGTWVAALRPVLDQFIVASEGSADPEFWRSLYKKNDSSGGPWATGWINVLFPYLKGGERNPYAEDWKEGLEESMGGGPSPADFPSGLSTVPLSWRYLEEIIPMSLVGGFVGVVQDPVSLALRSGLGWVVLEGAVPAEVQVSKGRV